MDAQTIGIVITLVMAWSGFLIGIIKWLLDRYHAVLQEKIMELSKENRELKEDVHKLRLDLPLQYVRREDCRNCREENIRFLNVLDQKLSSFAEKISDRIDKKIELLRVEFNEKRNG